MKNMLSCRPGSYGKYHETAFAHLQKIGIQHVEIGVPAPNELPKVQAELKRYGLRAASLQGTFDLADPQAADKLPPQLAAANALGASIIFLSVKRGEMDAAAAYARLRAAGDLAAKSRVTLALETHPDLITNGDVALATMRGVNDPNVRVNFDTANIYYYNQGIDGIAEMKKVLECIAAVHLKETNGGYHTWFFPAFGEGIVKFAEVFRLLNARGFTGPFTMEIEGIEGENLTREQTEARVLKSVEYLRRLGCVE